MKIDLSKEAVTKRLQTVNQLRKVCLSLANSSAGKKIRAEHADIKSVKRTSDALGRDES
jgi:hypothetical protein